MHPTPSAVLENADLCFLNKYANINDYCQVEEKIISSFIYLMDSATFEFAPLLCRPPR